MSIDTQNKSLIIASSISAEAEAATTLTSSAVLSDVQEIDTLDSYYITYQPISSNMVYESKDVVREDYVIQGTYLCLLDGSESDDCVRYFDTVEKALINKTFQTRRTTPSFYYRVVKFIHNSPVSVNKFATAEGLLDTEQDEESYITRSTCLIYVSRWLEYTEDGDSEASD